MQELRENCNWFSRARFEITMLRGIFEEVDNFYSCDFFLQDENNIYPITNGDLIKYKNDVYIVLYVEINKYVKKVHLSKIEVLE